MTVLKNCYTVRRLAPFLTQQERPSIVTHPVMLNIAWAIRLMHRTFVFNRLGCTQCNSAEIFILGFFSVQPRGFWKTSTVLQFEALLTYFGEGIVIA